MERMVDSGLITEEGLPVTLPSGAEFSVLTQAEVNYVNDRVQRYLADNHFVNVSDFQDVDRMLIMEVLCFRWATWISRQQDYFGDPIDESALRRSLNDYSQETRQLKKMLGIDKVARDKQKGEGSVAEYIENLRARAKEFGVMRETQLDKALELTQQLIALITLSDNCDQFEQRELHVTTNDVVDWIREVYIPEFQAVDAHFRQNSQRTWVRSM
jgi:hypothetical protein